MTPLEYIGLGIAALAGGISAWLMKVYKMGKYLDEPLEAPTSPVETKTPVISDITESTPTEAPASPQPYPKATLENLCLTLRDFEGLELNPKTGKPDQNWRLNNPGNCRYNKSGYLPMYGKVGRSANGFAIFETYEIGWLYLKNMIKNQIKKNPTWTLRNFIYNYAPPDDDNPTESYGLFLSKRLGVSMDFLMKNLV